VDCTGQADRDGNKVVLDPYSSNSSNLNGSTPAEDAAWIREELHRWIYGNVRAKWESVIRRGEGARCWQRVVSLFSGYQGYDPKRIVEVSETVCMLVSVSVILYSESYCCFFYMF
jgi:ribosome-binding ATPase YchF (GTP1/OBG family)